MQHIRYPSAETVKKAIDPVQFYASITGGSLGKPTSKGWHRWNGLCPFHDDTKAGSVSINHYTGAYKCFSCGAYHANIIDFFMAFEKCSFKEALYRLSKQEVK